MQGSSIQSKAQSKASLHGANQNGTATSVGGAGLGIGGTNISGVGMGVSFASGSISKDYVRISQNITHRSQTRDTNRKSMQSLSKQMSAAGHNHNQHLLNFGQQVAHRSNMSHAQREGINASQVLAQQSQP